LVLQACELENISPLDILVMHNIHHRNRAKLIADIASTLNIDNSLGEIAKTMRALSGFYDQASRAAGSL
tara:strand:+ start:5172 stop:5378 length:207 start_codon:yes stop_codon:yes gene_type:complete